jgi:hypothetical protein
MATVLPFGNPLVQFVGVFQLFVFPIHVVDGTLKLSTATLDKANEEVTQLKLDVSWQVTKLPSIGLVGVKVLEVAPETAMLFINHWYVGVAPPLVIEELKLIPVKHNVPLF